jgi:hypothetical protein
MTSVADSIRIRSHGIASATLASLDLARARIFYLVRLGFPPLVDVGIGDTVDPAKTMKLAVGDTGTITAKKHHFAIARVATESSIRAEGPFAMTYVNSADDPRKKH